MYMIKQTIMNWVKEHQRLSLVIAGAVGLPLALAIACGVVFLLANVLVWMGCSPAAAITILFLMLVGGLGGFLAYNWLDEND
jgi:UDP-N-acetylmuramyl pentapeptide phosphotransferase/UDP-N-acetylglucosamine-1-phosphate transferase